MKEEKLLTHRHCAQPKTYKKPAELIANAPNKVWSWDITFLPTSVLGMFYYLYMVMDIYSRKIIGWSIETSQTSEHASTLIKACCIAENIQQNQISLHSDNGGPMKGATMLSTLQLLGVMPSFSRPSVSDDNPYSESLFKTLKYCPFYPENKFTTLSAAQIWVSQFVHWYNHEHRHSGIRYVTPNQRHQGLDIDLLAQRHVVYTQAKQRIPSRWARDTRNWEPITQVTLNPATVTTPVSTVLMAA